MGITHFCLAVPKQITFVSWAVLSRAVIEKTGEIFIKPKKNINRPSDTIQHFYQVR